MSSQYAPGIPARITEYANSVKRRFEENATVSHVKERTEAAADLPVLPDGTSRTTFNKAIDELRGLVDNHVELVDKPLDDGWYLHRPLTHDAFALDEDDYFINSAICAPLNVEQVQAVVRWANKWLIPIYAVSMGRNLG
jgi:FAD/FMN-containing dehydrogenase